MAFMAFVDILRKEVNDRLFNEIGCMYRLAVSGADERLDVCL
jgi:hypothetical protein